MAIWHLELIVHFSFDRKLDLMNRAKCPETKEQWDKKQSHIRRVVDPETGRTR